MIFQNLSNIEPIDIVMILCHMAVIISSILIGILFILKARDKTPGIRRYILGIATLLLLFSISRMAMFIFELSVDPFVWRLRRDEVPITDFYILIWYIASITGMVGLLIFLIQLETQILEKKSKYILSIFQLTLSVLSWISGATEAEGLTLGKYILYFSVLPALLVPVIYFYFAGKSSGDARKRALGAGIGFLIFYLGVGVNSAAGKAIFQYLLGIPGIQLTYFLYGLFVSVGLIIYLKSIKY